MMQCAIIILCAWLARVPALPYHGSYRSGQTTDGARTALQPDFTMCDSKESCRAGEIYGLDLLRSVANRARSIIESGATPVLLQIGLSGLSNPAKFADVDLYNELSTMINVRDFRSVMVDPQSKLNEKLWGNVARTQLDRTKIHLVNGLVMSKCETANMSIVGFSDRIREVFGATTEYTGWARASGDAADAKKRLLGVLRAWVKNKLPAGHIAAKQWKDMAALPDSELLNYIEETSSLCLTSSTLLEEANVDASSLAMVVIDAEGEDKHIVDAFLQMQGFKPGFLQFEGVYSDFSEEVLALQKLGFWVGDTAQHKDGDAFNVLAVQPLAVVASAA